MTQQCQLQNIYTTQYTRVYRIKQIPENLFKGTGKMALQNNDFTSYNNRWYLLIDVRGIRRVGGQRRKGSEWWNEEVGRAVAEK